MTERLYDLLKIGLTEGEAKVYLALLELGSSTVGPIVKKSGVAYSNIYEILQRLIEKGITSYIIKNKTKYFQSASPSNLYKYLERKEKELIVQKNDLKKALPLLREIQETTPKQEAEIFIGKKGLRTAYEKITSNPGKNSEHLFFYIHGPEYGKEADLFYFSIEDDIIKKIPNIRGICDQNGRNSNFNKQAGYIDYKYVDFPIPGNIDIAKDMILLVTWGKPVIGILIKSQSIADNLKRYFESVWKVGKR
ncbi:hypothetical protein KY330_03495 [Candidatus Woesearchaeota archaeon]|nr:hypothetical protein [Candidatus Woesearchaeota archaeon]